MALNESEIVFCEAYMGNGYNAVAAYKIAHPGCSQHSANSCAYRSLAKADIKAYIREREKDLFEANGINAEHIANELATMAFAQVTDSSRLSYSDKMKALELLGKQLSLYSQTVDVKGLNNIVIKIGEEKTDQ